MFRYEQILLRVLVSEFHRTGVEECEVRAVFREMSTYLRLEGEGKGGGVR